MICFVIVVVPCVRFVDARIQTIVVPLHYSTIQYAINNASDGDTILVKSGYYTEKLVINKAISLIGEGKDSTTIYCGGDSYSGGPTIVVKADAVNITGFTIKNIINLPTNGAKPFSAHYGARSGIHLLHVNDCKVYENEIVDCGVGIWFYASQKNNVFDNTINKCSFGIVVAQSQDNYIEENEVSLCYYGLFLSSCSFNLFRNNVMTNNSYNFDVSGTQLVHYNNDVGSSNLVNGKKVYYFVNSADLEISPDYYPDASLVFVVNCINVNVKNLNLAHGGLFLVNSSSSMVTNNKISDTNLGMLLRSCSSIIVSENTLTSITGTGLLLEFSDRNLIDKNSVENTTDYAIHLVSSTGNNITRNVIEKGKDCCISLDKSHKNIVFDNDLIKIDVGISLLQSAENSINNNRIFSQESKPEPLTHDSHGIWFSNNCDRNEIFGNNIVDCEKGIFLEPDSVYVSAQGNTISNCGTGLTVGVKASTFAANTIYNSSKLAVSFIDGFYGLYNIFYNNNFISNPNQTNQPIINDWVYGSNGNYWSNYNGTDLNGDGVGDTPYIIDESNKDLFPLIDPVERFEVGTWDLKKCYIDIITNSAVADFVFNPDQNPSIKFNVDGQTATYQYCKVTIPKDVINSQNNWAVLVDNEPVFLTVTEEAENNFLDFTYDKTARSVEIIGTTAIPEFPWWIILLLFLIVSLIISLIHKKLFNSSDQQ